MNKKNANRCSFFKHHPGSRQIVLFIHGIAEGPKQFRNLAKIAYDEGNSIYILLLPGHGKSSEDFAKTNFKAWIRYVSCAVNQMRKRYTSIILVGHSMGALFCICEAASNTAKISQLVLIDLPLKVHVWPRAIKGAYKIFSHQVARDEKYVFSEYKAMSIQSIEEPKFIYLRWLSRYLELLTIIGYTRKQLSKVSVTSFFVFAEKDEFVSLKSTNYLKALTCPNRRLYLKDSGHFCYHHSDIEVLEKSFTEFIRSGKS